MIRTEEVICKWYYNQDSGVDVLRIQNQQFRLKNTENASFLKLHRLFIIKWAVIIINNMLWLKLTMKLENNLSNVKYLVLWYDILNE